MKRITSADNPDLADRFEYLAVRSAGNAIGDLMEKTGLHPASAACAFLDAVLIILDNMSREGTDLMVADLRSKSSNIDRQDNAMKLLAEGYEAHVAQIERDEAGGPIQ